MGKFTEEAIIKIIKKWAEGKAKQGEIEYDNSFDGGLIVRICSMKTAFFPFWIIRNQ